MGVKRVIRRAKAMTKDIQQLRLVAGVYKPGDKTITRYTLVRMSFCNSANMPQRVWIEGVLKAWVGIGWIELDDEEADGTEPTMIER